ncbi:DUF6343 family protein [Streptomyces sp. NPDC058335]|uniref:DUF6343 family protein n=1 Tax=Streptomyces sp. NPDC058335 TaxID=3346451 RepID=UPI003652E760
MEPGHHREERARRARSGTVGRRFARAGTEPATAQSALGLRLILSGVFLPVFAAAAVVFAMWAADSGPEDGPGRGPLTVLAVVYGALALLAAADLPVVVRRLRNERGTR